MGETGEIPLTDLRTSSEAQSQRDAAYRVLVPRWDIRDSTEGLATDAAKGYISYSQREHPGFERFINFIPALSTAAMGGVFVLAGLGSKDMSAIVTGVGMAAGGTSLSGYLEFFKKHTKKEVAELTKQAIGEGNGS